MIIVCVPSFAEAARPDRTATKKEIYIPQNLEDCFSELKKEMSKSELRAFKNKKENKLAEYHFSLGRWIRNRWGLWNGSRLAVYFNGLGIQHPDDMSGIITDSFWRHLNGRPVELETQINYYQKYWEEKIGNTPVPKLTTKKAS